MKDLLKIIKEKNELKSFEVETSIEVKLTIVTSDITNAGEEAMSELDLIDSELTDLGYTVTNKSIKEIEEKEINESVNDDILNKTPDEEFEKNILDIFNVVESRVNKLAPEIREKAYETLLFKIKNK